MQPRAKPLFAKEKEPQKRRLEEKRKYSFHRQRLPDHASSGSGKLRPVRPELKFHGDARHHSERKADSENFGPEPRRLVPALVTRAQRDALQNEYKQRKPHRELWKNVMKCDCKRELETMNC